MQEVVAFAASILFVRLRRASQARRPDKATAASDSTVHSSVDSFLFEDMLDDDFDLAEMFNPANPFKLTDLEELTVSDEHSLLPVDVNVVDGFYLRYPHKPSTSTL
ncbi:hypothetical protein AeMF1_020568 [Aphanomyces euteiches]|nr:hypothetical protein AeMF1_020568 [Aphanomyces euteiches]